MNTFEDPSDIAHRTFSSQLPYNSTRATSFEQGIQPWNEDQKLHSQFQSQRQAKTKTSQGKCKPRKKSIDERIEQMKKKYSKEGINLGAQIDKITPNSRQMYRQKLDWLQKGHQFKQLGAATPIDMTEELITSEENTQKQKTMYVTHFYCLDPSASKHSKAPSPKKPVEYKCSNNFQRMLKIKQKLRKKHTLAVSKQKQKYIEQMQNVPNSPRDSPFEFTAKATLERNKLKLKMRGLSQNQIYSFDSHLPMQVVGTTSNPFEYSVQTETIQISNYNSCQTQPNSQYALPKRTSRGQRFSR